MVRINIKSPPFTSPKKEMAESAAKVNTLWQLGHLPLKTRSFLSPFYKGFSFFRTIGSLRYDLFFNTWDFPVK